MIKELQQFEKMCVPINGWDASLKTAVNPKLCWNQTKSEFGEQFSSQALSRVY